MACQVDHSVSGAEQSNSEMHWNYLSAEGKKWPKGFRLFCCWCYYIYTLFSWNYQGSLLSIGYVHDKIIAPLESTEVWTTSTLLMRALLWVYIWEVINLKTPLETEHCRYSHQYLVSMLEELSDFWCLYIPVLLMPVYPIKIHWKKMHLEQYLW